MALKAIYRMVFIRALYFNQTFQGSWLFFNGKHAIEKVAPIKKKQAKLFARIDFEFHVKSELGV